MDKYISTRETCPPYLRTPLTEGRPNLGEYIIGAGKWLGYTKLADWQYDFLCLATEYEEGNPEDGIVPYWRRLTLTIPRQSGKSECVCAIMYLLRWMNLYKQDEPPKMIYTSQNIEAAVDMWDTKAGKRFRESQWGKKKGFYINHAPAKLHARLGGRPNTLMEGGRIRILANSGKSGRGGSEDFVIMDEVREFGDDSSREKTLDPLMNMRPSPQILLVSTMGTQESGYFNRRVHAGREQATAQNNDEWPPVRLAYWEHGVGDVKPDGYAVDDVDMWKRAHPALGCGYWDLERMTEKYDLAVMNEDLQLFQQEYLNQMFYVENNPAIPWEIWEAVEPKGIVGFDKLGNDVILAVFAEPDSYYVSVVAVGNGIMKVIRPVEDKNEILRVPTYTCEGWLKDYIHTHPQIKHIVYQEGNDLEAVLSKFKVRGVRLHPVNFSQYKDGCRALKKAIVMENIQIVRNKFLHMALQAAETQDSADKSTWYWRKKPDAQAPVDELRASVLAWKVYDNMLSRPKAGIVNLTDLKAKGDEGLTDFQKERLAMWNKAHGR